MSGGSPSPAPLRGLPSPGGRGIKTGERYVAALPGQGEAQIWIWRLTPIQRRGEGRGAGPFRGAIWLPRRESLSS